MGRGNRLGQRGPFGHSPHLIHLRNHKTEDVSEARHTDIRTMFRVARSGFVL